MKSSDLKNITKKFTVSKYTKEVIDSPDQETKKRDRNKGDSFKRFDNVIKIKEKLLASDNFNFNIFELEGLVKDKTLEVLSHYVFEKLNYFELKYFDEITFKTFTQEISEGYLRIPYHNSIHACDVFQTT